MNDDWPVLPAGVEAVTLHTMPPGYTPPPADCFVCGEPMPDASEGAMCWLIPGRGTAHNGCYEPSEDDT